MGSFNRREHVVAAFLDVEKAFDNVWHNGLRYEIFMLDLPTKMTRWFSGFLVGRVIQVNVNGFLSDQISPAGSVLSPLLFLIYVNDLPKRHHRQNSKSQFADDTALWAASRNVHIAAKLLQKDLRKLAKWCAKWRIKINPEKTKVMIFSRSYLAGKPEPTLKLYGERLKIYPQVKFLGITFDSKFTFKKHFEDILGRCNARYHRIRLLTNKKWGPSPSTVLQIYKQCVRPIFKYGSLSTLTTSDTIISEIQRLQNKFIRLALCLPKYVSVKLLHDSSGLPSISSIIAWHKSIPDAKFQLDSSSSYGDMTLQIFSWEKKTSHQILLFTPLNEFNVIKWAFMFRIVLLDPKLTPMSISAISE